jgi:hypothetical protein
MSTAHADRGHALWSASSSARHFQCPGALALSQTAPAGKESIHAARGTAAHEVAEFCLRHGGQCVEHTGLTVRTKEHEIEVDEEIADSAQMYVDYVRSAADGGDVTLMIEQRFTLDALDPPFEAGGTGDAVLYFPESRSLEIVDLKNGMGVVDPKDNPQLRTYAVGAMLANEGLDVEKITVTIVQPRAPHKDGRIRSETFHVADLIDWTGRMLDAMNQAKRAKDAFDEINGNSVKLDDWAESWLRPGKCSFCPAEGFCPAVRKQALAVAAAWFDDGGTLQTNSFDDASPEAVARDLDGIPALESWIAARSAFAKQLAESGASIPGWQLVERIGNRKWKDEQAAETRLLAAGIAPHTKKLVSPAQAEKLLGAKRKAVVDDLTDRPVTGTNLVSVNKTTRPAAQSTAERYFDANA